MIASAFHELLTEDVAEKEVFILRVLSIFQILRQDIYHCLIQWHDERLSVFRDVDIHRVIIKVNVFDLNVHKAPLSDSCAKQEIGHYPTLILCKITSLNIGLLQ